jgi:hypothetical protein
LGKPRRHSQDTPNAPLAKAGRFFSRACTGFDTLMPMASKTAKAAKKPSQEKAIFKLFSPGVATNRDEWVYEDSKSDRPARARHPGQRGNAGDRRSHAHRTALKQDFVRLG